MDNLILNKLDCVGGFLDFRGIRVQSVGSRLYLPHFIVPSGETVYSVTSQCLSPPWSVIGYKEIFSEV